MGSNINATVTKGYTWTDNADGTVGPITKDRLNQTASPTVVVPLNEDYIPKAVISVGDESSDTIAITVQVSSFQSNAVSAHFKLRCWLSDTQYGARTSTAPDDAVSWTIGTMLRDLSWQGDTFADSTLTNVDWEVITSSSGVAVLSIKNTTANTWYLNVELDGRIWASAAIAFT